MFQLFVMSQRGAIPKTAQARLWSNCKATASAGSNIAELGVTCCSRRSDVTAKTNSDLQGHSGMKRQTGRLPGGGYNTGTEDPRTPPTLPPGHTHTLTDPQPAQEYQEGCCLPNLLYIYPPPALPLFAQWTEAPADGRLASGHWSHFHWWHNGPTSRCAGPRPAM